MEPSVICPRWSSCQADFYSSSDSSGDEYDDDVFDYLEDEEEKGDDEVVRREIKRVTKIEALAMLKENGDDLDLTVLNMLKDVTHDSLDHLSSQCEERKVKKARNLKRKLTKLKALFSKHNIERKQKAGEDIFISETQESFVEDVKEEKKSKEDEEIFDDLNIEDNQKSDGKFKKAFNRLTTESKRNRTDVILRAVEEHAQTQQLSTTELLAYLLYRVNYHSRDRAFSLQMLKLSMGESEVEKVQTEKALAIVSRGKFGRTAYTYVKRMLKPHKEGGHKLIYSKYFLKTSCKTKSNT